MTKENPDFPERGSIELIDQYGNHIMLVWYPIPFFQFEHLRINTAGDQQKLPDCGERSPNRMKQTFEWVIEHCKKAQKIIDSTVDEVKITDDSKRGKRGKSKRKRGKKKSVGRS